MSQDAAGRLVKTSGPGRLGRAGCSETHAQVVGSVSTPRRTPLRGKTGEPVSASTGRIGRPDYYATGDSE